MATMKKVLNTQIKEQQVSNGRVSKVNHEVASPVASNLPNPGKPVAYKKAVERVFEKDSELFHRLAKVENCQNS